MQLSTVLRSLLSGVVVYMISAACSAELASSRGAGDAGFLDALANPVGEASAQPAGADVAEEPCTTVVKVSGMDWYAAIHAYPGKKPVDLVTLQVLLGPTDNDVEGYPYSVGTGARVRDGSAMALCSPASSGQTSATVTFILPK